MDVKRTRLHASLPIAVAALILLAACSPGSSASPSEEPPASGEPSASVAESTAPAVEGFVDINGSSTVEPITSAVAEAFKAQNDGFDYAVEGIGTGDGFKDFFCLGETDINDASRQIDADEEVPICDENGVTYLELLIAYDGLTVFTHPDTAIDCLNLQDLYALFGPESSDFTTWEDAQAFAGELGSTTTFPTGDLQITAPGEESGTYTSFIDLALADIIEERGAEEALGTHYTPSPNDNVIVENVSANPGTLGFAGFAFYTNNTDRLKAIQIDTGDGCSEPTPDSIADGSYPLSRPLFVYVNTGKLAENAALASFIDYYLGDEGIANVTSEGYVELPTDELDATRQAWEAEGA